jgi:hypothetical protein
LTIDNFIPTVWAASVLENLNDDHVYANCVNRDYEGEISSYGDTVKIGSIGRPTYRAYTKGATLTAPETLNASDQLLIIDHAGYFNFEIDNIDKRQQKPKLMDAATKEGAWVVADAVDDSIAALIKANIATTNPQGNSMDLGDHSIGFGAADTNPYELLVDMDVRLTESNTPRGMRWCVVPAWFEGALRKDERFVSFGTSENRANLRGRPVGEASGMTIWISNNTPTGDTINTVVSRCILAGYKGAVTYAEQIEQTEAFKPQNRFSDALKCLHVYGHKVTRPSNVARADVVPA